MTSGRQGLANMQHCGPASKQKGWCCWATGSAVEAGVVPARASVGFRPYFKEAALAPVRSPGISRDLGLRETAILYEVDLSAIDGCGTPMEKRLRPHSPP